MREIKNIGLQRVYGHSELISYCFVDFLKETDDSSFVEIVTTLALN